MNANRVKTNFTYFLYDRIHLFEGFVMLNLQFLTMCHVGCWLPFDVLPAKQYPLFLNYKAILFANE